MEDIASETLGVNADERRVAVEVSHHQHYGFFNPVCEMPHEAENSEVAEAGREPGVGYFFQTKHTHIIRWNARTTFSSLADEAGGGRFAGEYSRPIKPIC